MLPAPYHQLQQELGAFMPTTRLITDPLRLLTWGTDASFYRLVPQLVVVAERRRRGPAPARMLRASGNAGDVPRRRHQPVRPGAQRLGAGAARRRLARHRVADDAHTITLQPGVIGAAANRKLAPPAARSAPTRRRSTPR